VGVGKKIGEYWGGLWRRGGKGAERDGKGRERVRDKECVKEGEKRGDIRVTRREEQSRGV